MDRGQFRIAGVGAAVVMCLAGCASTPTLAPNPTTRSAAPNPTTGSAAPSASTSSAAGTPGFTPGGSPLTLAWQSNALRDPIHLALGPNGNIFVGTGTQTGLIRVFDPDGHFVRAWGVDGSDDGQFSFLLGIGVDGQGNVYAADFQRMLVNKFDATGTFLTSWATEPPVGPAGLAVDRQGNVYIVNHRTHAHMVQKFDSNGKLLAEWAARGSGEGEIGAGDSGGPEDLAVDAQGNVYVADRLNGRIEKFDTNGKFLATIGTPGPGGHGQMNGPGDVTVDGLGNIYVVDAAFLQKFDAAGTFVAEWSTTEGPLQRAGEVMADPKGNLYVNTDTILEKFSQ